MASSTKENSPPAEQRFKEEMKTLFDITSDLITQANERGFHGINSQTLQQAQKFIDSFSDHNMVLNYIRYSYQFWPHIAARDEQFFLKEIGAIFEFVPIGEEASKFFGNLFSRLCTEKDNNGLSYVNDEDKDDYWESFTLLIKISINYMRDNPGTVREIETYFNIDKRPAKIDLSSLGKKWGLSWA